MKSTIINLFTLAVILLAACDSKESTWTQQQKNELLGKCNQTFAQDGINSEDEAILKEFCDCMLKVTTRDYTPEEADNLTQDQKRIIIQDCNYSW